MNSRFNDLHVLLIGVKDQDRQILHRLDVEDVVGGRIPLRLVESSVPLDLD